MRANRLTLLTIAVLMLAPTATAAEAERNLGLDEQWLQVYLDIYAQMEEEVDIDSEKDWEAQQRLRAELQMAALMATMRAKVAALRAPVEEPEPVTEALDQVPTPEAAVGLEATASHDEAPVATLTVQAAGHSYIVSSQRAQMPWDWNWQATDGSGSPTMGPEPAPVQGAEAPTFRPSSTQVVVPDASPVVLLVATLASATAAAGAAAVVPGWRRAVVQAFKASPLAGLFTRILKNKALDHPTRAAIVEYAEQNAGERIEVVRRALELPNGTFRHHLQILQDQELIRVVQDAGMTRVFPAGPKVECAPYLSEPQARLLHEARRRPGLTQRQISGRVGLSERMVSYHLGRLREYGLVEVRRLGGRNHCFPASCPKS